MRQPTQRSGRRSGRGSYSGGRSSASGRGAMLGGLAVIAAALAGGSYLYLHTPAAQQATTSAVQQAEPDLAKPRRATPAPRPPVEEPGTSPGAAAPVAPPHVADSLPAPPLAPFGASEEAFEAGARLYATNCAGCHGRPGRNGSGPDAAQFWDRSHAAGSHAVAQPVGVLYQATARGNLAQGMPSYGQRLTDTQIWDMALLIGSAHNDLPEPVLRLLRGGR